MDERGSSEEVSRNKSHNPLYSNKKSIISEVVLQSQFEDDSGEHQSYVSPVPKKRDFEEVP